jgi:hypothetical protein
LLSRSVLADRGFESPRNDVQTRQLSIPEVIQLKLDALKSALEKKLGAL